MQLGTWTIPLLPAVAVGVAVVLAGLVLWGVLRARRTSDAPSQAAHGDDGEEPQERDWTGEAAGGAADPPRPPRPMTVADVVAARGADTQPMAAVPAGTPATAWGAAPMPAVTGASHAGGARLSRPGPPPAADASGARPAAAGQHRATNDPPDTPLVDDPRPDDPRPTRRWTPRHAFAEATPGPADGPVELDGDGGPDVGLTAAVGEGTSAETPETPEPESEAAGAPGAQVPGSSEVPAGDRSLDEATAGDGSPDELLSGDEADRAGREPSAHGTGDGRGGIGTSGEASGGSEPLRAASGWSAFGAGERSAGDEESSDRTDDPGRVVVPDLEEDSDGPEPVGTGPVPPPWSPARTAAATESSEGTGPAESVSLAVQQALAARAVQAARGRPDVPDLADDVPVSLPDARDRLLSVLLTDPVTALGATTELDDTRARIDRLGDVLRRRRADLATAVHRLHASGLTGDQIGRLAGLDDNDVREILEEPSGEGSGGR